jgi:hypothetical protein
VHSELPLRGSPSRTRDCRLGDWGKAGWPRSYFDTWYARKLKQAGVDAPLVDRLGLRLERLAPGLRRLGLTRTQADRLVTTAELVL